ncbi:hypothetical protein JYT86_00555 [bacterium AH-315-N03]|nr:hypothetical protein [bacterium AH-315-N03]
MLTRQDEILSHFVDCLNETGPKSERVGAFLEEYRSDTELFGLLEESLILYREVRGLTEDGDAGETKIPSVPSPPA